MFPKVEERYTPRFDTCIAEFAMFVVPPKRNNSAGIELW